MNDNKAIIIKFTLDSINCTTDYTRCLIREHFTDSTILSYTGVTVQRSCFYKQVPKGLGSGVDNCERKFVFLDVIVNIS